MASTKSSDYSNNDSSRNDDIDENDQQTTTTTTTTTSSSSSAAAVSTVSGRQEKLISLLRQSISEADCLGFEYAAIEKRLTGQMKQTDQLQTKCVSLHRKLEREVERSKMLEAKCASLESELQTLKKTPCSNCPKLRKCIETYKQKTKEAETRLLSVAKILNVQHADNAASIAFGAAAIASQVYYASSSPSITEENDDSKRTADHFDVYDDDDNVENDKRQSSVVITGGGNSNNYYVSAAAAADVSFNSRRSFDRSSAANSCDKLELKRTHSTPLDAISKKKQKTLLDVDDDEIGLICDSPIVQINPRPRRLTSSNGKGAISSKDNNRNVPFPFFGCGSVSNNNTTTTANKNVTTGDDKTSNRKNVWHMKKTRDMMVTTDKSKLKQMTLAVAINAKQKDISKVSGYNGGSTNTTIKTSPNTTSVVEKNTDDDDDVVVATDPKSRSEEQQQNNNLSNSNLIENNINNNDAKTTNAIITTGNSSWEDIVGSSIEIRNDAIDLLTHEFEQPKNILSPFSTTLDDDSVHDEDNNSIEQPNETRSIMMTNESKPDPNVVISDKCSSNNDAIDPNGIRFIPPTNNDDVFFERPVVVGVIGDENKIDCNSEIRFIIQHEEENDYSLLQRIMQPPTVNSDGEIDPDETQFIPTNSFLASVIKARGGRRCNKTTDDIVVEKPNDQDDEPMMDKLIKPGGGLSKMLLNRNEQNNNEEPPSITTINNTAADEILRSSPCREISNNLLKPNAAEPPVNTGDVTNVATTSIISVTTTTTITTKHHPINAINSSDENASNLSTPCRKILIDLFNFGDEPVATTTAAAAAVIVTTTISTIATTKATSVATAINTTSKATVAATSIATAINTTSKATVAATSVATAINTTSKATVAATSTAINTIGTTSKATVAATSVATAINTITTTTTTTTIGTTSKATVAKTTTSGASTVTTTATAAANTTNNKTTAAAGFRIIRRRINNKESSPPYKYRRDAMKKASERKKLPGQECVECYKFYQGMKQNMTDSQYKIFLNKCSRHRDKYTIRENTPPGFWNPRFDDTQEECEK